MNNGELFEMVNTFFGKGLGNSFFFGILFTTLIVRTLAWPIYSKQNSMSLKTTLMQCIIYNGTSPMAQW